MAWLFSAKSSADRPSALRYRDFRFFCAYRMLSGIALQMQNVAVGYYIYSVTGSALALGLTGLTVFLPSLLLSLFSGHAADNFDRRLIVTVSFGICALAALALFVMTTAGLQTVWPIYVCTALVGIGRGFGNPASQAITPNLVPPDHFANAVTWYSSAWQLATIIGPAIGGLVYAVGNASSVFAVSTCVFAAASLCVFAIRTPLTRKSARAPMTKETLLAGFKFILSRQVVFGAISLDLVAVLLGGATAIYPILARDLLHTGPEGLGLLRSAPAIGAIAMSLLIARYPIKHRAGDIMLSAIVVFGLMTMGLGFSRELWLSMLFLAGIGASDMVSVVIRHTMVQSETPDDMRGRVAAVNSIFIGASSDLGEFESGLTAQLMGAVPAVIVGGALTVVTGAAWGWLFPALKARDDPAKG